MRILAWIGLVLLPLQQQKTAIPTVPKEKEAELRKTYSAELTSKARESASKLLDDAGGTKDDPVTRYALLDLASKLARDLSDFPLAFKAIDLMDEHYSDVNPFAQKQRLLEEARRKNPKTVESVEALAQGDLDWKRGPSPARCGSDAGTATFTSAGSRSFPSRAKAKG